MWHLSVTVAKYVMDLWWWSIETKTPVVLISLQGQWCFHLPRAGHSLSKLGVSKILELVHICSIEFNDELVEKHTCKRSHPYVDWSERYAHCALFATNGCSFLPSDFRFVIIIFLFITLLCFFTFFWHVLLWWFHKLNIS